MRDLNDLGVCIFFIIKFSIFRVFDGSTYLWLSYPFYASDYSFQFVVSNDQTSPAYELT